MLVEIRGVGFVNKGAELMLHAILQKMQKKYPDARFVMTPSLNVSPYINRAKLGLYQKVTYQKFGIEWGSLAKLVSKKRRAMYGLILDDEIDVVLDAAGFAHGDQWGVRNTKKLKNLTKNWKANKTKVILLPQAFGPFTNSEIKNNMVDLTDNIDLIFSRESMSHDYLSSIIQDKSKMYKMPDFTNLVEGVKSDNFDSKENNFCIIPNYKMESKKWSDGKGDYLTFIVKCIKYLQKNNKKPFILVHEGKKDMALAKKISEEVGGLNILIEEDALKVKGIIGACDGVIGSRFHSLVSSLSQGIPTLGTSWSHKYQMLFEDYAFKEGILQLDASDEEIEKKIDILISPKSREELIDTLKVKSKELKQLSNKMWEKVFSIL